MLPRGAGLDIPMAKVTNRMLETLVKRQESTQTAEMNPEPFVCVGFVSPIPDALLLTVNKVWSDLRLVSFYRLSGNSQAYNNDLLMFARPSEDFPNGYPSPTSKTYRKCFLGCPV